jgi:LPXTG-motif cell wall-anchored protein
MANRWLRRASAAAAVVGLALVFGGGTAWAVPSRAMTALDNPTIIWDHHGTNADGICSNIGNSDDLNPPQGQEGWVFILTSPAGDTSTLTFDFNPDAITQSPLSPGEKEANGSIHFVVYTPLGAALQSASATNGTGNSQLNVSHCENGTPVGTPPPPPPSIKSSITSEVRLANNKVIDDSSNPGTAPADVHDSVTVTVTGLDFWSGTINETFYDTNNCDSKIIDSATVDVDQSTTMPVDVLPETKLPAGEYSYQAMFVDKNNDVLSTSGVCEPFKIVAAPTPTPPTTTSTPSLPVTGSSLTGILVAGVVLIAGGGAILLVMRRRRSVTEL